MCSSTFEALYVSANNLFCLVTWLLSGFDQGRFPAAALYSHVAAKEITLRLW
jgi:hypothetical protein